MEVDLKDLLVASGKLEQMADVYESVIDRLQQIVGRDAAAFEEVGLHDAWVALRNVFWRYSAESRAEAAEVPLGADAVDGILNNMAIAVNEVYAKLDEGNDRLRSVLCDVEAQMADNKLACLAPRPVSFADATQDNVIEVVEGSR